MLNKDTQQVTLPAGQPALRVVAMPRDTNGEGSIFGGWLMSQVDIAGSIIALARARGRVATVAVNNFHFRKPVLVGDLLSCFANVKTTGKTSVTVHVDVYVQRNASAPECLQVADAELTYVALDAKRRPRLKPAEEKS